MPESRVPTSDRPTPPGEGWSVETVLDHVLALHNSHQAAGRLMVQEKIDHVLTLVEANDKRYAQQAEAQKEAINAALAAADRAVAKAEAATEKRFESVNEFRGTLDNQQRTLIPRSEVNVMIRGLEDKIDNLTKIIDAQTAERAGIKGGWGYAVGVFGLVLTVLSMVGFALMYITRFRP